MKNMMKPWFWPLPALVISIIILAASRHVWLVETTMSSKGGMVENIPAHTMIIVWLIMLPIYGISFLPFFCDFIEGMTYSARFVSQGSHAAEGGCAVILIRGLLLIGMYLLTYGYLKDYFFR